MPQRCPALSPSNYADEGGSRCPACLSGDIDASKPKAFTVETWQTVTCRACGAAWDDVFILKRYEDLTLPKTKETP